jgi:hypothetical protein
MLRVPSSTFLHNLWQRRVPADSVDLIQDNCKSQAIGLASPKHIPIDFGQDERPCRDLELFT